MVALAAIERAGVPIDADLLGRLQASWPSIRSRLIEAVDPGRYDCYEGGEFRHARFAAMLGRMGIDGAWPRTEKAGRLSTERQVFRAKADMYPSLRGLYELRETLASVNTAALPVGTDGRHRAAMWSAFGTDTARNAPRKFVFAPARWIRHVIKPPPGRVLVYSDYSAEEVHVAARLSGDPMMIKAAESGDPYLWFGRETRLAPPDAPVPRGLWEGGQ
jgi:hypothetical protein